MDLPTRNGVVFEGEETSRYASSSTSSENGLIGSVIRNSDGAIKTRKGAEKFLLACVAVLLVGAVYFFVHSQFHEDKPPLRTPDKYLRPGSL